MKLSQRKIIHHLLKKLNPIKRKEKLQEWIINYSQAIKSKMTKLGKGLSKVGDLSFPNLNGSWGFLLKSKERKRIQKKIGGREAPFF